LKKLNQFKFDIFWLYDWGIDNNPEVIIDNGCIVNMDQWISHAEKYLITSKKTILFWNIFILKKT
jgi:hypothetical protein